MSSSAASPRFTESDGVQGRVSRSLREQAKAETDEKSTKEHEVIAKEKQSLVSLQEKPLVTPILGKEKPY